MLHQGAGDPRLLFPLAQEHSIRCGLLPHDDLDHGVDGIK